MPPRLPITDEERRERKRAQDHNAHIRRMESCGLEPRGRLIEVARARDIRKAYWHRMMTSERGVNV